MYDFMGHQLRKIKFKSHMTKFVLSIILHQCFNVHNIVFFCCCCCCWWMCMPYMRLVLQILTPSPSVNALPTSCSWHVSYIWQLFHSELVCRNLIAPYNLLFFVHCFMAAVIFIVTSHVLNINKAFLAFISSIIYSFCFVITACNLKRNFWFWSIYAFVLYFLYISCISICSYLYIYLTLFIFLFIT